MIEHGPSWLPIPACQVWHEVPTISYYKELRVVATHCIQEIALRNPAVMRYVKTVPETELFERIPLDLLQEVVGLITAIPRGAAMGKLYGH